jgi:hypothetical protein
MASIVFKDFSINVRESVEELKGKYVDKDFVEVTEYMYANTELTDVKTLININHVILIRE